MIISALQVATCLALAVVSIRQRFSQAARMDCYPILLPYVTAAGVLGVILVGPVMMELFVAYYSGAMFEIESMAYRCNSPYWWVYGSALVIPLFPLVGLFPMIGKQPLLVAILAFCAAIPVVFWTVSGFFFN